MKLYHLCGKDPEAVFSPYGWRAVLCLMHKGLQFEIEPTRFLEISKLSHVAPQTIPVLDDGEMSIVDSLEIAEYLDKKYPQPSLFGGSVAAVQAPLLNRWVDTVLVVGIVKLVLTDIYDALGPDDQVYFRETREKRFGCTLEEVMVGRDENREVFRKSLAPLRLILDKAPFLSGATPLWFDYAVFGTFLWPHVISNYQILDESDPVYAWQERMFDMFDGVLHNIKRAY